MDMLKTSLSDESAGWFRALIDTAVDGIIVIDPAGRVQIFNPACEKLFGYAAGEVVGENVKMLMPKPYHAEHDGYLEHYLETGERRIIGIGRQVTGRRKDGSVFPMELSVAEVTESGNHAFVGIIRDVTDAKDRERELHQSQKMRAIGELTGGVAHDFNNLLLVISGNLEMLESQLDDETERAILAEAKEASEIAAQLTGRLLAFARRQPLDPKVLDLNELTLEMSGLVRRTLGEAVQIDTILGSGLRKALADPGQVQNALLNLAVNARDAMPKGGHLTIETANIDLDDGYTAIREDVVSGPYVKISVTDTGTGMTPEIRDRAFEPFFTTKKTGEGTGLGLSMIYGFAKQSGGHLSIYSEVGHGTTVSLYLPQAGSDAPVSGTTATGHTLQANGETVLVVEDDPRVRRVTCARLDDLGYRVLQAENGASALELLAGSGFVDLLFTDVVMPGGMSGQELAEQVRRDWPEIKVVFTTGYAEQAVVQNGTLEPGVRVLRKPYSKAVLAALLREVFDG